MFEFLLSNWIIFLVVFILLLLILIGYLIDRDNAKKTKLLKQSGNYTTKESLELEKNNTSKVVDSVSLTDEYITKNQEKFNYFYDDLFEDDNNELDMEFNKIISKQNLLDEKIKKSIENIKIEPIKLSVNYQYATNDIVLPDIKK